MRQKPVFTGNEELAKSWLDVTMQIIQGAVTQLYLSMRYLDLALGALTCCPDTSFEGIGTDGVLLVTNPQLLADLYERDSRLVNRVYLHNVIHCLLRHPFKRTGEDPVLWEIACNIAVESIIDSMNHRCIRTGISRRRMDWYETLHRKNKVLTAERVCRQLKEMDLSPTVIGFLQEEFNIDDHSLWPGNDPDADPPQLQMMQERWQDISEKTGTNMETFASDQAQGAGNLLEEMKAENRERMDYREFLKRFAVWHEEIKADPDTFDYVFYTYGLSLYGNLPLIEPQEQREVKKIQEFVIVIDVSMSTSGDLVQNFLDQTYKVLSGQDSYSGRTNIRIICCDEKVRSDIRITNREEMEKALKNFTLEGGGGTDFRPAFEYVDELIRNGEINDLKGLIYFTDGRGTYPARPPRYDTAFVFMEEDYTDVEVPPWAIRLVVEKEELEEVSESDEVFH